MFKCDEEVSDDNSNFLYHVNSCISAPMIFSHSISLTFCTVNVTLCHSILCNSSLLHQSKQLPKLL